MVEFILREGTLNDDTLMVASKGKIFKGGHIAIVKIYTFATSWSNNVEIKMFRSKDRLFKFIDKHYPEAEDFCFYDTVLEN